MRAEVPSGRKLRLMMEDATAKADEAKATSDEAKTAADTTAASMNEYMDALLGLGATDETEATDAE